MSTQLGLFNSAPRVPKSKRLDLAVKRHLGQHVRVILTDQKSTILSSGKAGARVHQMFLDADDDTMDAVGRFLKSGDRDAAQVIDAFIENFGFLVDPSPDVTRDDARGEHHDLLPLFQVLNRRYFGGEITAALTWGKRGARPQGGRGSITLGTYEDRAKLITIHPALDQAIVPQTAVARVLHHEMCHAKHKAVRSAAGRRMIHTPAFRAEEARYEDARFADRWIDDNLDLLLRYGSR